MESFTHLGRTISLDDALNRWMLGVCAAAAVAALAYPGGRSPAAAAFSVGLTVFLVWALIRELDPDHPVTALVGAAAAGTLAIVTAASSLITVAIVMVTARIVVRSTGLRPLLSDIAVVGALVGAFSRTPLIWAVGLGLAFGVALDTTLPEPAPQRNVWLAGAIGLAVTLSAVLSGAVRIVWSAPGPVTVTLGIVALALVTTAPSQEISSVGDYRRTPLHPERLRAARLLAASALTLGTIVGGAAYATMAWPGWVGLIAAGAGARWMQ